MENQRNRAEGWQYAKLSGHRNEAKIKNLFDNEEYKNKFSERLGVTSIVSASIGGLHEGDVDCIIGGKTKSKTDLKLTLTDKSRLNFSIKKSAGGQVFLIGVERFIDGYEKHYATIPDNVKEALRLYFAGHPQIEEILNDKTLVGAEPYTLVSYQKRKSRLVKVTLEKYDKSLSDALIQWMKSNIVNITDFCFAKGLASNPEEWSVYLWYKNEVGGRLTEKLYNISDIKRAVAEKADAVIYGTRMGGSTIQLPFGFLQWHQGQMQFHHQLKKILTLVESL
ncbi:MAG: hypothetical protein IKB24_01525 [Alistipes sp.]|nr:hypothetical protein [Alistipes sp.]